MSALSIGLVLFPKLTQLDLTGPLEVFSRVPDAQVHLLWKDLKPVASDKGFAIVPTMTFTDCPKLDVICVPGGPGQVDLMDDTEMLDFLRRAAPDCRWITSVCTGSLVLGAAGLLKGYKATCHWGSIDQLALLGVEPVAERIVRDRNRMTGGGVTSGIDFALALVSEMVGREVAEAIQLQLEYDPQPPFNAGTPRTAPTGVLADVKKKMADFIAKRRAATEKAAKNLAAG
jgi:cyclohexyl-isocyanide hydratase